MIEDYYKLLDCAVQAASVALDVRDDARARSRRYARDHVNRASFVSRNCASNMRKDRNLEEAVASLTSAAHMLDAGRYEDAERLAEDALAHLARLANEYRYLLDRKHGKGVEALTRLAEIRRVANWAVDAVVKEAAGPAWTGMVAYTGVFTSGVTDLDSGVIAIDPRTGLGGPIAEEKTAGTLAHEIAHALTADLAVHDQHESEAIARKAEEAAKEMVMAGDLRHELWALVDCLYSTGIAMAPSAEAFGIFPVVSTALETIEREARRACTAAAAKAEEIGRRLYEAVEKAITGTHNA